MGDKETCGQSGFALVHPEENQGEMPPFFRELVKKLEELDQRVVTQNGKNYKAKGQCSQTYQEAELVLATQTPPRAVLRLKGFTGSPWQLDKITQAFKDHTWPKMFGGGDTNLYLIVESTQQENLGEVKIEIQSKKRREMTAKRPLGYQVILDIVSTMEPFDGKFSRSKYAHQKLKAGEYLP